MKIFFITAIVLVFGWMYWLSIDSNKSTIKAQDQIMDTKLKISFGETQLTATLFDNPTSRDFISMLPITTELEDYASNEKIFYPEHKLADSGAPAGYNPSKGDITYYAPWGDVAIFYKDFSYSTGLISLGKIDENGVDKLKNADGPVTFALMQE